jgi:uncharacterized protein (TIGR03437 family)
MSFESPTLNRRRTLALLGGLGLSAVLPAESDPSPQAAAACATSTPQVTEGPYWADEKLFRADLRTDPSTGVAPQGVPLTLAITVIDSISGNCVPLSGAWVDLWHCDAIGIYSDESTYNPGGGTGNVSTTGQKFLRGYQITDANGQVNFTTIYPGWYAGRTIHIHARIRTWTTTNYTTELADFVTQIFFDETTNNGVLAQAPYNTRTSKRDTTNATDSVYNGAQNKTAMLATLTQTSSGYAASMTFDVSMMTVSTPAAPVINAGGVVNAASNAAGVSPGAWISIFGTNLTSTAYTAAATDLTEGMLPTQLQSVSVQIDGKPAFMQYVSPTQLNVQAPADSNTGQASVSVTTAAGVSNSVQATMQAVLPGPFAQSGYLLAVRPSDGAVINGTGAAVAGYTVAAGAKAGDYLEIFGTGLGPTVGGTAPGIVFSGADQSTQTVTATVGGQPATVLWAGLVAAGLWQINLHVPSGIDGGDPAVVVTAGGKSSQSGVALKITAS